ncbi:serine protease svh-1-like [Mercenaria mercenaria]|uniref:serine protease svh-1-like n=1 Tax=Mercenaria mercenaria TaxID=6596 RepID=UPI00234EAF93|nr:serine protease svh-1-like [Mercenaria mercenaria]
MMRSLIWITIACTLAIVAPLSEAECEGKMRTNCTAHNDCGAKEACMTPPNGLSQCYACPCNEKSQCEFIPNKGRQWQCNCGSSGFSGRVCDCPPTTPAVCQSYTNEFVVFTGYFYDGDGTETINEDLADCKSYCLDTMANCGMFSYDSEQQNCTLFSKSDTPKFLKDAVANILYTANQNQVQIRKCAT